jgi:hypothetical protein
VALTIDGSDPTGDLGDLLASKLDLAGGKILQIVRATDATTRTTTSTSFVDASISVTITPQKEDSALIIVHNCRLFMAEANFILTQITDASNNALSGAQAGQYGVASAVNKFAMQTLIGYATPATTSPVTYKVRFRVFSGGTASIQNADATGQLYAIEVSA